MLLKKKHRATIFTILLLLLCLAINLLSRNDFWIENYYSNRLFPSLSRVQRYFFGWIPFSIGDILYALLLLWLLKNMFRWIHRVFIKRQFRISGKVLLRKLLSIFVFLMIIYFSFNFLWGINYSRQGIAQQLDLKIEKYSEADLQKLNLLLVQKVNEEKTISLVERQELKWKDMNEMVLRSFKEGAKKYPFAEPSPMSLKPSMWGWLGNYMGFTGYYNPFTGEAQVNTTVPLLLQPYIACHEVAHQIGYAKEMEANFVGFLAGSSSPHALVRYSVYFDLFRYANRNLYARDSSSARAFRDQLLPAVKDDIADVRKFSLAHQGFVEPLALWAYGIFLQGNNQPQGILSYDEVTGFLIAFYKKQGII